MQYDHFNWFERAWNSTLGLPEQLVRRMFRVATQGINPFSEEGFGDASLIPILGALDKNRKDVKDPEFLNSINQTFGTKLNPEGFAPALFTSILTDPLSWLTGGATVAAKQAQAAKKLRYSDSLKELDFSNATVGELRTAATSAAGKEGIEQGQKDLLLDQLNKLGDADDTMTLSQLRKAEQDRQLMVALPFLERFEGARIYTLSPEHQSWTRLAWDGATKNSGAKALGATSRSLVSFAKEIPMLGHVVHYMAEAAHGYSLANASAGLKAAFKTGNRLLGEEGEALHSFAAQHQTLNSQIISRGRFKIVSEILEFERKQKANRLRANDPSLSAKERASARRSADRTDRISREEILLRAVYGPDKVKDLTAKQIQEQGQKLWNDLNFGTETALWTDSSKLKDTIYRFNEDVDDAVNQLYDSFIERVRTTETDAAIKANSLNQLGKAVYGLTNFNRKWVNKIFKTDTEGGFLEWLGAEKEFRSGVARASTAVEARATIIGQFLEKTAEEVGMEAEVLDSVVLGLLEVSATHAEIDGLLELALEAGPQAYADASRSYIQRAAGSINRMSELLRGAGRDDLADSLDEIGFNALERRGVGAEYDTPRRSEKIVVDRSKPRLRFGEPISFTLPDGRQLGYLDNKELVKARERLDKIRQRDTQLAQKLERMPGVGRKSTAVREELQGKTVKELRQYAKTNQLKISANSKTRKADLLEMIEDAALRREAKRLRIDPALIDEANNSDELQSLIRVKRANQTKEGRKILKELEELEEIPENAEQAIDRLLDMRSRGSAQQVKFKTRERFAGPEVPERTPEAVGEAKQVATPDLLGTTTVLDEAEAGTIQAEVYKMIALTRELNRVANPDPTLIRELANSHKFISDYMEDLVRKEFNKAGESGEQLLNLLRETQVEVFNANYRAGVIRPGSPIAYVGRFLNGPQRQALNDLIDGIPGEVKDQIAPELSQLFGRTADNMSVHELNELHRELARLAPDSKYSEDLRKALEDAGVSTDRYVESAQLSVLATFADAQRREVTADFMDDVINSGMEEGIHRVKGFEVVGFVNTKTARRFKPVEKKLKGRTEKVGDKERETTFFEKGQEPDDFNAIVLRDQDGNQITVDFNSINGSETGLVIRALGKHGEDISYGQAAAQSSFSDLGKTLQDLVKSKMDMNEANQLLGQRVLVGTREFMNETHRLITDTFKAQSDFWAVYDQAHTMVKGLQTVWRPDFHVANFASSLFQMGLTQGVRINHTVGGLLDAFRVVFADEDNLARNIDAAAELLSPGKGVKGVYGRSVIRRSAALSSRVARRGVLEGPNRFDRLEELTVKELREIASSLGVKGKSKTDLIDRIRKAKGGKKNLETGRPAEGGVQVRGRDTTYVQVGDEAFDIEELVDVMARYGMLSSYVREGLRGSGNITDTLMRMRDRAFGKTTKRIDKITEVTREVQEFSETFVRFASMFTMIRAGYSPETAAKLTKRWMVDYNDLTRIERNGLKRVFSFYTFPRKFIPAAIRALDADPSKVGHMSAWVQAALNDGSMDVSEGRLILNYDEDKRIDISRLNAPMEAMVFVPRLVSALGVHVPVGPGVQDETVLQRLSGAPGVKEASAIFRFGSLADAAALFGSDPQIDDPSTLGELSRITPVTKWLYSRWQLGSLTGAKDIERSYLEEAAFQLLPYRQVPEDHMAKKMQAQITQAQSLISARIADAQDKDNADLFEYWTGIFEETDQIVSSYLNTPEGTVQEKLPF